MASPNSLNARLARLREGRRAGTRRTLVILLIAFAGVAFLGVLTLKLLSPPPLQEATDRFLETWNRSPTEAVKQFRHERADINVDSIFASFGRFEHRPVPLLPPDLESAIDGGRTLARFGGSFIGRSNFHVQADVDFPLAEDPGLFVRTYFRCDPLGEWELWAARAYIPRILVED